MVDIAAEHDGKRILAITQATGVFSQMDVDCVQELWDAWQKQGEASGYVFLVYRSDGGEAAGYACFGPTPLTEGTFDLFWIAVDPQAQTHGVGRALLARVEQEVRARGGRLLLIETSGTPAYKAARRFYESCGYRYQAVVHDFYAPGDDLLIFSKHLMRASPL